MILLDEARMILDKAGYRTNYPAESKNILYFEDETLLGFVVTYFLIEELLSKWREHEASFLRTYAKVLRNAPEKAWNAYSVLLTQEKCKDASLRNELLAIEENFQSTRKIARSGLLSSSDVVDALSEGLWGRS